MNQTKKKIDKKTNFGPNFGPNLGPSFFGKSYLYLQLDIVPSYHAMQFKGKLMNQT